MKSFQRAIRAGRASAWIAVMSSTPPLIAVALCTMAIMARGESSLPLQSEIEHVSKQGIEYWFIALAVLAIVSWSFIVKWLINQLESQRTAHAQITDRLINYMQEDHAKAIATADRTLTALSSVTDFLEDIRYSNQQQQQPRKA